ncbi:ATP-binding protein [Litoribacillus peritrichatus]|uniref:Histidine kinase domain-containing protein n=1 Tax=Litoribacillus peritrichatus TaxID=718191 RepID=A0ABP7M783_9GAMM
MLSPNPLDFAKTFPFHIVISNDQHMLIKQVGGSLHDLYPDIKAGDFLREHFDIERPKRNPTIQDIHLSIKTTFLLRHKHTSLSFRYQVLGNEDAFLFFVGSPIVNSVGEFEKYGLKLSHFSPHDVLPDFLMVIEPKELYLKDIQSLAKRLQESRDHLVESNQQLLNKNEELAEARTMADLRNQQLIELNKSLEQTQAQLIQSEKLASIGGLAAGIAHELNQPLGVISLQAELAIEKYKVNPHENHEAALQQIMKQVQRATAIIDHLKLFGRDAEDLPKTPCQVNQLIDAVLTLFREPLRLRNITLQVHYETELPPVLCNEIQIEQVLTNLLSNARDALEQTSDKRIDVACSYENGQIIISVCDNGEGIPHELKGRIFDPFYTTKDVGKGTGLGLSVCYSIIKDHHGEIRVNSEPGKGSNFAVILPSANTV